MQKGRANKAMPLLHRFRLLHHQSHQPQVLWKKVAPYSPLVMMAQSLAKTGNYKAAMGKLDEADAVKSTPDDATVINQLRQYIAGCIAGTNRMCAPSQP